MKALVLKENLNKALSIASRFASSRAQLPILSNFKLKAKGNLLTITATNLEMSLSLSMGVKVEEEGEIAIPAKTLTELVSSIKAQTITLEAKDEQLHVMSDKSKSQVMGINASEFPDVPQTLKGDKYKISTKSLLFGLSKTLFAVSNDESRPILTGVLFLINKASIRFVSTDGFRLSLVDENLDEGDIETKFILPKNILNEITKIISENETVNFSFDKESNQVIFEVGEMFISSRVIQGEFPDFERIIPKSSQTNVLLGRDDLMDILKTSAIFARDSANVIKMDLTNNTLTITSQSQTAGTQESSIEIKKEGDDLSIAYNYKFVEDFLNSIKGESVEAVFNGSNVAGIFKDPSISSYLHIIMPIKL